MIPVPDPDLEITGGGHPDPLIRGEGGRSKNKGGGPTGPCPGSATEYQQR